MIVVDDLSSYNLADLLGSKVIGKISSDLAHIISCNFMEN